MAIIDKNMYETLKNWCDRKRPENQYMMYVNSRDRMLTDATIRKLIYEKNEEDEYGEEYVFLYSAEHFFHNMREYYTYIAELYMHKVADDDPIIDIINDFSPLSGWITLILEDVEKLSEKAEMAQEMITTLFRFATRRANIILIGNGNYKDVFSGCENALDEMEAGVCATEEERMVMVGCYDQEPVPSREGVTYESPEDQCDELVFYWNIVYKQLKRGYFDYSNFKNLYKETLEFLIPRVTKQKVFRKDLWLLDKIGNLRCKGEKSIEGCELWEYEAAQKMAMALFNAIINRHGDNDDFSKGEIYIEVTVEDREIHHGAIHISGWTPVEIKMCVDTVHRKMDRLAEAILESAYQGNKGQALEFMLEEKAEVENETISTENVEKALGIMGSLENAFKEAADNTVNKVPGTKVCRYQGNPDDCLAELSGDRTEFKILTRHYNVSVDKIKGVEKLDQGKLMDHEASLSCYTVVLDKTRYTINADGKPEMTKAAQEEYDEFISKIHQWYTEYDSDLAGTLDEGYGEGEDELDWHITGYSMWEDNIVGVVEIDTCVRTEEPTQ